MPYVYIQYNWEVLPFLLGNSNEIYLAYQKLERNIKKMNFQILK